MSESAALPPLEVLSDFAATLRFEALPAALVEKAKLHILDTLGAALAGTASNEFAVVRGTLGARGDGALVWGTAHRASPRDAALANGVAAHAFELDDCGGCDHSGAVVLPALLAALSQAAAVVSGRELIVATIVGYEIGRRVLDAAGGYDGHNGAGWHSTGTCGTMAAASAVARLRQLDRAAMRDAITLATSFSSGLWAFIHDGSQAKKIHAGRAAEGGLLAAELAAGSFRGPAKVFEEVWGGFFRSFNGKPGDLTHFTADLGAAWKLDRAALKPYASCRGAHSAVDAVADMLGESGRTAEEIEAIDVRLSEMLHDMCGGADLTRLAATQMSLSYAVAARCVFGEAGLSVYAEAKRRDPRIADMLARIRLARDPGMPAMAEPAVRILFRDGRAVERCVPRPTGAPERPMRRDAVLAKFAELAGMALGETDVHALRETVAGLETLADCRTLETHLTRRGPGPSLFY
jgi:2-methylcitrate dehydratase PrpD